VLRDYLLQQEPPLQQPWQWQPLQSRQLSPRQQLMQHEQSPAPQHG
jgi:hypothetical protein